MPTFKEKLDVFASTIIILNYKDHPLYETFLHEYEFKIDTAIKKVEEMYLFNNEHD